MEEKVSRPTALEVSDSTVLLCRWNGEDAHHAHALHGLTPGAVVSVGDGVPHEAIGGLIAFHWYQRIGDRCVPVRGDGTLYDERYAANYRGAGCCGPRGWDRVSEPGFDGLGTSSASLDRGVGPPEPLGGGAARTLYGFWSAYTMCRLGERAIHA